MTEKKKFEKLEYDADKDIFVSDNGNKIRIRVVD